MKDVQKEPEQTEAHLKKFQDATPVLDKPGFRPCIRKGGYVLEDGIGKKIEGHLRVGYGHQILISQPGQNNNMVFEIVAASTLGKGFGKGYAARPDAKAIIMGKIQDLEHEKFEEMVIAGAASDIRDPAREPAVGRARRAKTIVRVGFGTIPSKFILYTRSILGQRFQALVDEEISDFRVDGSSEPLLLRT
jgi:hypothetical protein